jgi:hypothetical protein
MNPGILIAVILFTFTSASASADSNYLDESDCKSILDAAYPPGMAGYTSCTLRDEKVADGVDVHFNISLYGGIMGNPYYLKGRVISREGREPKISYDEWDSPLTPGEDYTDAMVGFALTGAALSALASMAANSSSSDSSSSYNDSGYAASSCYEYEKACESYCYTLPTSATGGLARNPKWDCMGHCDKISCGANDTHYDLCQNRKYNCKAQCEGVRGPVPEKFGNPWRDCFGECDSICY